MFYLHSGIMFAGAVGFGLLAQGEVQEWAKPQVQMKTNTDADDTLL